MKNFRNVITIVFVLQLFLASTSALFAQTFTKGSLLVSVSEGSAHIKYHTADTHNPHDVIRDGHVDGDRDPITVEYGVTNHIGIGLNMGTDLFTVNPSDYYGFKTPDNRVKAIMNELTVECNYHFFTSAHTDISAFGSVGIASVNFKGNGEGDMSYKYEASGGVVRAGAKARYYVWRRFGLLGMFSIYSAGCTTDGVKGNTVGNNVATGVSGYALEFGLCYRILK